MISAHRWLVLPVALLCITGCQSKSSDPLAAFKYLISQAQSKAAGEFGIENVQYDVKKTDSLATPYTGQVSFRAYSKGTSEDSAALKDARAGLADGYLGRYTFQDGNWTLSTFEKSVLTTAPLRPVDADNALRKYFAP